MTSHCCLEGKAQSLNSCNNVPTGRIESVFLTVGPHLGCDYIGCISLTWLVASVMALGRLLSGALNEGFHPIYYLTPEPLISPWQVQTCPSYWLVPRVREIGTGDQSHKNNCPEKIK